METRTREQTTFLLPLFGFFWSGIVSVLVFLVGILRYFFCDSGACVALCGCVVTGNCLRAIGCEMIGTVGADSFRGSHQ